MIIRTIVFLVINFSALGIGSLFTTDGVSSAWYQELNKAPWTPPGWVFGAAWSLIMICYALYMSYAWKKVDNKPFLVTLFIVQWILNVLWNPVFFKYHQITIGLVLISLLTLLIGYFFVRYKEPLKSQSLFILPYFIWLLIATSLNAYILLYN